MDIIIFSAIGWLTPKILEKLKIKFSPYQGILLSLLIIVGVTLFLSYCLFSKLPVPKYLNGDSISTVPIGIALLALTINIFLVIKKQKPVINTQPKDSTNAVWILYCFPAFSIAISKYAFLLSIYSPKLFNSETIIPEIGVTIFILGTIITSITIYFFSRFKNAKNPELFFWISLLTLMFVCYQTTLYSLLLLYGLISTLSISYPTLASLMTIGYLPLVISLFAMAFRKDHISKITV